MVVYETHRNVMNHFIVNSSSIITPLIGEKDYISCHDSIVVVVVFLAVETREICDLRTFNNCM